MIWKWRVQAKPYLQAGAFEIVDESLKGTFDVESMRKAALVAIKCVERDASKRPSIAEVLAELKEAYNVQLSYLATHDMTILRKYTLKNTWSFLSELREKQENEMKDLHSEMGIGMS